MRPRGLALTALLLAALSAAAAQPAQTPPVAPPAPPAAPAAADPLDGWLSQWQMTMEGVQSLSATLKRTEKDQTTGVTSNFTGYTKYLRINSGGSVQNLALLEMTPEGKKDFSERFVCSGSFLYEFRPSEKEVRAHEIPKPKSGQVSDDNFLSFLFGMKKEDAQKRYSLTLEQTDRHPTGVDDNYIYVMIEPRFAADKVDFKRAQIVLNKKTLFPRRLWFEQPNSTETTWEVVQIKNNDPSVDRREFDAPTPPPGWTMVKAPRDAESPPRVVRPSGN